MFDARAFAFILNALDISRRHHAAQEGIFGITFEVASGNGCAVNVDGGGEQNMRAFGIEFICQDIANLFDQVRIPGGAERNANGCSNGRRCHAAPRAACAVGTVRGFELWNAETGNANAMP